MKHFILTFGMCMAAYFALAQDQHFTQFYGSPLTLNPALTGAFDGRYRVSGIYRDQWRGVLDQPYTTFSTAIDVRFDLELNSRFKDAIAAGIMFFSDNVGVIDFSTNQLGLSVAYHKGLDWDKKQFLTLGIQGALGQRNVNFNTLTFDDQFDGSTGYVNPTGEEFPSNNFSFSDLNIGLNYTFNPKERTALYIGAAMHHVFSPRISFYEELSEEEQAIREEGSGVNLLTKYSAQLSAELPISKEDEVSLLPRLLFASQGSHLQFNTGTNIRFKLSESSDLAMQLGAWVRPVKNESDEFFIDAFVGLLGLEINSIFIGLSYDINAKDLSTYQQGQGAFEISVTYLGSYENESILCPTF